MSAALVASLAALGLPAGLAGADAPPLTGADAGAWLATLGDGVVPVLLHAARRMAAMLKPAAIRMVIVRTGLLQKFGRADPRIRPPWPASSSRGPRPGSLWPPLRAPCSTAGCG